MITPSVTMTMITYSRFVGIGGLIGFVIRAIVSFADTFERLDALIFLSVSGESALSHPQRLASTGVSQR